MTTTDPTTIQHCNICDGASRAELSTYLGELVCVDCIADHEKAVRPRRNAKRVRSV